jgi:hypothetical protein
MSINDKNELSEVLDNSVKINYPEEVSNCELSKDEIDSIQKTIENNYTPVAITLMQMSYFDLLDIYCNLYKMLFILKYSMKEISGLNIRVARQIIGCADKIISEILVNNEFTDTLIVSLPGLGKTTILRDLVRQISNSGKDVSLIDERSEIAAIFNGAPKNDVGIRTDVMDGVLKPDGIIMMVRSMKPDFIATDEIGTDIDIEAILYAVNAGVKIIATAHGTAWRI